MQNFAVNFLPDTLIGHYSADIWLKYCRYGVNHYPINQSIYERLSIDSFDRRLLNTENTFKTTKVHLNERI